MNITRLIAGLVLLLALGSGYLWWSSSEPHFPSPYPGAKLDYSQLQGVVCSFHEFDRNVPMEQILAYYDKAYIDGGWQRVGGGRGRYVREDYHASVDTQGGIVSVYSVKNGVFDACRPIAPGLK